MSGQCKKYAFVKGEEEVRVGDVDNYINFVKK
jgi:hypothetical protein